MSEKQYSKVYFLCQALLCIIPLQSVKHEKREHPLRMRRAFSFLSKGGVTIPTSPNNGRRLPVPSSVAHLYPLLLYHRNSKCQHAITRQYFFRFPLSIKLRTRFGFNLYTDLAKSCPFVDTRTATLTNTWSISTSRTYSMELSFLFCAT